MKKRLLSAVIAGMISLSLVFPTVTVKADPTSDAQSARSEYEKLTAKVNELNQKVEEFDSQISSLVLKVKDNEAKIDSINKEIDETNKAIDKAKKDINAQEEVLGERLREVYKSGGETSYLAVIFSADSLSDLISKISSAKKVIQLDNDMIDNLNSQKDKLDEEKQSLQEKGNEINKLNDKIKQQKSEVESKKADQEKLVAKAKEEQKQYDSKYLAVAEREIVKSLISVVKNSNQTSGNIKDSISRLRNIRDNQLKSPTVVAEVNAAIEEGKTNLITAQNRERAAAQEAQRNASQSSQSSSSSSASQSSSSNQTVNRGDTHPGSTSAIVNEAYKHLGKRYVWGATGPDTFDCSGFTSYVYRVAAGIGIGRTTYDQINAGREVAYSELQPGDLVFPHAGHVGIYIGNGLMIHAPQTGDVVKVSTVYKFWRARRIIG